MCTKAVSDATSSARLQHDGLPCPSLFTASSCPAITPARLPLGSENAQPGIITVTAISLQACSWWWPMQAVAA